MMQKEFNNLPIDPCSVVQGIKKFIEGVNNLNLLIGLVQLCKDLKPLFMIIQKDSTPDELIGQLHKELKTVMII